MDPNIFDIAGKKKIKPDTRPAVYKQTEKDLSLSPLSQSELEEVLNRGYGDQDPDVSAMFARMNEMQSDLEAKLMKIRQEGEARHFDVDRYLETTLFNAASIEKNFQQRKELEENVDRAITKESCIKKLKSKERLTQERKNKSLGSRKNWIPMR